jgi:hypothetical protein
MDEEEEKEKRKWKKRKRKKKKDGYMSPLPLILDSPRQGSQSVSVGNDPKIRRDN